MATTGRNGRQHDHAAGARLGGHRTARPAERASFEDVVRIARDLPRRTREWVRDRPEVALAAVAGASFIAGALLGSRVVRAVFYAAFPYAISRMMPRIMEGAIGDKARKYASDLMGNIAVNHAPNN